MLKETFHTLEGEPKERESSTIIPTSPTLPLGPKQVVLTISPIFTYNLQPGSGDAYLFATQSNSSYRVEFIIYTEHNADCILFVE
jgi:hypothetical protein